LGKLARRLWLENAGGSLVEYAFLLGLMLLAVGAIVAGFSGATKGSLSRASSSMAGGLNRSRGAAASAAKPSTSGPTVTVIPGISEAWQWGKGYASRYHVRF
jgi:Flp pilus assembly pilin Flp